MKLLMILSLFVLSDAVFAADAGQTQVKEIIGKLMVVNQPITRNSCKSKSAPTQVQAILTSWLTKSSITEPIYIYSGKDSADSFKCLNLSSFDMGHTVGTVDEPSDAHPNKTLESICFEQDAQKNIVVSSITHTCYFAP